MSAQFSWFDLIVIVGIVQGIVSTGLLLFRRKGNTARLFLGLAILAFCLLSFKILLLTLGLWEIPFWRYFPLGVDLSIAPLLYLYTLALVRPNFSWKMKHLWLFAPFFLFELFALWVYVSLWPLEDIVAKDLRAASFYFEVVKDFEDLLTLLTALLGIGFSLREVATYRKLINSDTSDTSITQLKWLFNVLVIMCPLVAIMLVNTILDDVFDYGNSKFFRWQLFYLVVAALVYYLGFEGYRRHSAWPKLKFVTPKGKGKPKISVDRMNDIQSRFLQLMTKEKWYLNAQLSSKMVVDALGIDANDLSQTLKYRFNSNFRELINQYRVQEVKGLLMDPEKKHLSILGKAYEAGFNSEASFYRIFKKETGQSPKAFIAKKNSQKEK
ncbi:helix-turn-helix domain-containing protein [Sediminicola luteus]|uniref:HTH araC/xylS-type domain-containing protein n=1 Tax=Sediminicola luteus TaxID=319238 RepID=A0A2A4GF70_9FLAO|nr:helix-turn-helix domain-containing protein [Sediminicola luteus]PCE66664.1 hypothetical protein B7P33_05050 [Sediminicola luteus]